MSMRFLERVEGIEPSSSAWKAVALPLSYTRICGEDNLFSFHERKKSKCRIFGAEDGIRTHDIHLGKVTLYP